MEDIHVEQLKWTSENVRHVRRHGGSAAAVEAVLATSPLFFLNREGHEASHVMIGPDYRGKFWTIALLHVSGREWMPITGWPSKRKELRLYQETKGEK